MYLVSEPKRGLSHESDTVDHLILPRARVFISLPNNGNCFEMISDCESELTDKSAVVTASPPTDTRNIS